MTWTWARGIGAGVRWCPVARGGREAPGSGGTGEERFVRGLDDIAPIRRKPRSYLSQRGGNRHVRTGRSTSRVARALVLDARVAVARIGRMHRKL